MKEPKERYDFDFGFSLLTEEELKAYEKKLEEGLSEVTTTKIKTEEKLILLRDMIMILLNNLLVDPGKSYIYWPNRKEKIQAFIRKINEIIDN